MLLHCRDGDQYALETKIADLAIENGSRFAACAKDGSFGPQGPYIKSRAGVPLNGDYGAPTGPPSSSHATPYYPNDRGFRPMDARDPCGPGIGPGPRYAGGPSCTAAANGYPHSPPSKAHGPPRPDYPHPAAGFDDFGSNRGFDRGFDSAYERGVDSRGFDRGFSNGSLHPSQNFPRDPGYYGSREYGPVPHPSGPDAPPRRNMGPTPPPEVCRDSRGFAVEPVADGTGRFSYPSYNGPQQQPFMGVPAAAADAQRGFSSTSDYSPPQGDTRGFSSSRGTDAYRGGPPPYAAGSGFDPRFAPPPPPPPPRPRQQQQAGERDTAAAAAASAAMGNGRSAAFAADNAAAAAAPAAVSAAAAVPRPNGVAIGRAGNPTKESTETTSATAAAPVPEIQQAKEQQKEDFAQEEEKVSSSSMYPAAILGDCPESCCCCNLMSRVVLLSVCSASWAAGLYSDELGSSRCFAARLLRVCKGLPGM